MAQVPVSTFDDEPILYPFLEESNGYLKFPRHQLCRQNSTLAILAVDPSRVNIHLTRSRNYNLLKSRETQNESPSISSSNNSRESIERIKVNASLDDQQQNTVKVIRSELTLTSVDKTVEHIDRRDWGKSISPKTFIESSVTDIDRMQSPSEMDDDDKDMLLVGQNLLQISKGMDFLTCDVNTVCLLLSNDKLGVWKESVVFRAAYKWLTYRLPTRMVYADQIMRCVRFGLMRPRDLIKCFVRCQRIGLMDSCDFCEQFFIGLLWSIAKKYDLSHLIDELKPKDRQSNESDDSLSDEPVFSSGISSRLSLVSNQSSMTDVSLISINKYGIEKIK